MQTLTLAEREQAILRKLAHLELRCLDRGFTLQRPTIRYKSGIKYAGKAYWPQNLIVLSQDFLIRNYNDMVHNTLPHEVAHLVAARLFPKAKPHGFTWQSIMIDWFQVPPSRCHNYDTRVRSVDLDDLLE